jgi:formylglycine-generating enzyme required for sulfatase activity
VGSFPLNAFGLYDMHGNVYEWCADHRHKNYNGAPNDGSAWLSDNENNSRLLRGGSWDSDPQDCRSALRFINIPDNSNDDIGLRVVASSRT